MKAEKYCNTRRVGNVWHHSLICKCNEGLLRPCNASVVIQILRDVLKRDVVFYVEILCSMIFVS